MSESASDAGAADAAAAGAAAEAETTPPRRPCCRCHTTSLWSVWYGAAVLAGTTYLVYQAGTRFLTCTRLAWRGGERPFWELNSYMALVGGAVVLLPFLLAASCFRMGNLANDGVRLGAHVTACSRDTSGAVWADTWLRRAWVHGGPTAAFLHLVTAMFLLLPRLILEAKLIDAGYLDSDRVWSGTLDHLLGAGSQPTLVFTPTDNRSFVAPPSSSSSPTAAAWASVSAPADPVDSRRAAGEIARQFGPASAPGGELVNYACALLVFGLQYASCFWSGNKCFGLLFSAHNVVTAAVSLAAWEGFAVLYRLHAVGAGELSGARRHLLLDTPTTAALYLLTAALLLASTSVLYLYGYHKYRLYLVRQRQRYELEVPARRPALGYASHCAALLLLAAAAGCQGPLVHDLALVTRAGRGSAALVCCAALVLHLLLWVLLWLLLSVKHRWTFKLRVVLGRAHLRSAEQIKLVHEVEVCQRRAAADRAEGQPAPLLVVSSGRVAAVADPAVRHNISELVRGHVQGRRQRWEQEEVYWHKPSLPTPQPSPESEVAGWSSQRRPQPAAESKHKRGHSRKLSSARAAMPDTEVTDLRTPDLTDTEDDDLATNANQNSSHLHHSKARVSAS
ncbi:Protein tincar [Amphibalanus amphitrite]|uniref:Protein tincar n=1 Tax=Amphibalanus amphitrite TaxID=1232801 RepID=A0A6A4X8D7_AMPAM|nr:Protein tincar [Amphibalanus amphitrite]